MNEQGKVGWKGTRGFKKKIVGTLSVGSHTQTHTHTYIVDNIKLQQVLFFSKTLYWREILSVM